MQRPFRRTPGLEYLVDRSTSRHALFMRFRINPLAFAVGPRQPGLTVRLDHKRTKKCVVFPSLPALLRFPHRLRRRSSRSSSSTPITPSTTRMNQLAPGMSTRNSGRLHSNRDRIIPDRFTSNSDYPEQAEPLLAKAFELGVLYVPATLVPACFSRFTTYLGSCNPMLTKFSAKDYSVWK